MPAGLPPIPAGLKYTLGRLGLLVACAVPALLFLPRELNPLLKLLIALVVSAALSFVLLRRWRDEVADRMSENYQRRVKQKERLRSALADDAASGATADDASKRRPPP